MFVLKNGLVGKTSVPKPLTSAKMPTNLWTKLESPWIPKIQQNFQPQLRSYHRKQRPSQVSPLCIYFTITFSPNIWNNQKLTSEHFPKNIKKCINGHQNSLTFCINCMWSKNRGASFNLLPGLHLRGGAEPSTSPKLFQFEGLKFLKPMKESYQKPSCFFQQKIQVNKTSFTKFQLIHLISERAVSESSPLKLTPRRQHLELEGSWWLRW